MFPGKLVRQIKLLPEILYQITFKQFIYIHIPKTAGTSIATTTSNSPYKKRFISMAHAVNAHAIKKHGRNWSLFTSIRNPLSWYVSLYNFKIHTDPTHPIKDYPRMSKNSWEDFFDDIILDKNGLEGFKKWHKPWEPKLYLQEMISSRNKQIGFLTLNFIYYCIKDWKNIMQQENIFEYVKTNYNHILSVDHILRVEHLQDDFNRMVANKNINIIFDKKINEYKHAPYMEYYSGNSAEIVREKDRLIFEIFGYQ